MSFEHAREEVARLLDNYQRLDPQRIKRYNEENTKKDFILPLFKALGWNVDDSSEVAAEEKVSNKRVDYALKLGGVSRLLVEAKPLGADLFSPDFARQAINYGYNLGVSWAILTNFEEIIVFYALAETKDLGRARYLHLASEDYVTNFDKLWLLSRESVAQARLDEEAEKTGLMPARRPPSVEKKLYAQLRQWREELFTQLLRYDQPFNPPNQDANASLRNIDEAIQRLFNRLIFIRTCEDRGIEDKRLRAMVNEWRSRGGRGSLLNALRDVFKHFDSIYDSDLFAWHMLDEAFLETPIVEKIIEGLYDVPGGLASYDFSVIDADVLGQVYEQYLGHVAVAARERANELQRRFDLGLVTTAIELEEKKQKRKDSGIYYTPKWAVDYIVQQTVGRILKGKNSTNVSDLKILDLSCGSGAFLTRALDELLKHRAQLEGRAITELGQADRLSVLSSNIFGVDLDKQAVEIARLNLLIKALAQPGTLPKLSDNIKQGNSLISGGESELRSYFGDEWEAQQPFNWEKEFQGIMSEGGFDIVVGNPPYAGFQGFKEKDYLKDAYETAKGRFDLYIPFVELGLRLLKPGGLLSYICPTNFMKRGHGEALRKYCKTHTTILEIVDFGDLKVFEEALNYTGIIVLRNEVPPPGHRINYKQGSISDQPQEFDQSGLDDKLWIFPSVAASTIVASIDSNPTSQLGELCLGISEGIVTGKNSVFVMPSTRSTEIGLEQEIVRPVLHGKNIRRYFVEQVDSVVIYPYEPQNGKSIPIKEEQLQEKYPQVWDYLTSTRSQLSGRNYFDASRKAWFELWCERNYETQASDKIVVAEMAEGNRFALCKASEFYLDSACGITLKPGIDLRFILGVLNSRLMDFYYKSTTVPKANKFFIYKTMFLKRIPIRLINFDIANEKAMHDELVSLVERMLALQERLEPTREIASLEVDRIQRQMAQVDAEIDEVVSDLYGLDKEQRSIVQAQATLPKESHAERRRR